MKFSRTLLLGLCSWYVITASAVLAVDEEDEKAEARVMMRRVWTAIMAYKKDQGEVPDHLSDLIPRYLPNEDSLIAPKQRRTGQAGDNNYHDPKFSTSFCYEFSALRFAGNTETFRTVKSAQMEEFGGVVPILRCFLYAPRIMNVGYAGDFYESQLFWETAPEARAVTAQIGAGRGFANGEFATLTLQDEQSGAPIAGAEVRITNRHYHFLPLPDRTLVTGADGKARVPLGPARPPSRKLTVAVTAPGYFAAPETWTEGKLPEEAVIGMERAQRLEGILKIGGGPPLEGARITVSAKCPTGDKPDGISELVLETITTGAGGRWTCDRFPQNLAAVWLQVRHPAAWSTTFKTDGDSDWSRKAQKNLGETVRVLAVLPAAPVSGTVTNVGGLPVAGAEVYILPRVPLPTDCADALPAPAGPRATAKTDARGRYEMPWCDAGRFFLIAFPPGGVPRRLELQAVQAMRIQDIALAPGRTIAGQITTEQGEAAVGIGIDLCGWGDDGLAVEKRVATSDASGHFSWTSAPAESVMLRFQRDGFFHRCVPVSADATEPMNVRMYARDRK